MTEGIFDITSRIKDNDSISILDEAIATFEEYLTSNNVTIR